VCADHDVDLAEGEVRKHLLRFSRGAEAGEHFNPDREGGEAALEGFKVLEAENSGGREDGYLLAVAERLERGAHSDFGFPVAHVATQQPLHGLRALHVALDLGDGGELVPSSRVFKGVFKLALPVGVR
jgi:hypothetical protein